MFVVLLTFLKVHTWLLSCWHLKKSRYGCCPGSIFKKPRYSCYHVDIFKSPGMFVVLLSPAGTFKIKSSDLVVILLTLS